MAVNIPLEIRKLLYVQNPKKTSVTSAISDLRRLYSNGLLNQQQIFKDQQIHHKIETKNIYISEIKSINTQLKTIKNESEKRRLRIQKNEIFKQKEGLEEIIQNHRETNHAIINGISNKINAHLSSQKKTEKLLGTLMLNYSTEDSNLRMLVNSQTKPIYQTTLISLMLKDLIDSKYNFKNSKIKSIVNNLEIPKEGKRTDIQENYEILCEQLFTPITQAIYIHQLGLNSPQSKKILEENEQTLNDKQRIEYLKTSQLKSLEFLMYGINVIRPKLDTKQQETEWIQESKSKILFIRDIIKSINSGKGELGEIIKVCQQYTALIIQDKPKYNSGLEIHAYQLMQSRAKEKKINPIFTERLLSTMGQFPIGTGILTYESDYSSIEKAIVTKLYPKNPKEPTIRKVTRRELYQRPKSEETLQQKNNLIFTFKNIPKDLQEKYKNQPTNQNNKPMLFWKPNSVFGNRIQEQHLW